MLKLYFSQTIKQLGLLIRGEIKKNTWILKKNVTLLLSLAPQVKESEMAVDIESKRDGLRVINPSSIALSPSLSFVD